MPCVAKLALVPDPPPLGFSASGTRFSLGPGSRLVQWRERATRLNATLALALALAAGLLSGGVAAAASLGTSTGGLDAGSQVIASCGKGMTFAYTATYYGGKRSYALDGIDLTNIPVGCLSKRLSATFYDGSGTPLGSAITDILPASGTTQSMSIDPTSNHIDTADVAGISIVVS